MAANHVTQSLAQGIHGCVPATITAALLLTIPGHERGPGGPGLPSQRAVSPPARILLPTDRPSLSSNPKSRHDM